MKQRVLGRELSKNKKFIFFGDPAIIAVKL